MIKQLNIENTQSHKNSSLDFDKGVNIIVGPSDSGKSAILRALRLLVWNRPLGDAIRSNWGGKTVIEMFTDDAHIVRTKDKTDEYILGDQHFKAFRTDVPDEIQQALNLTEINLQQQLDAPFLLSLSPGQVAEHFNKVAKLEQIDKATSNVNGSIRELEQSIGREATKDKPATGLIKQIQDAENQLKRFDHLKKLEAEVEVLEGMETKLRSLRGSLSSITIQIQDYQECEKFIESSKSILVDEDKVNNLLALYEEKAELEEKRENLQSLLENVFLNRDDIEEAESWVEDESTVKNLLSLYDSKRTAEKAFTALQEAVLDLNDIDISLNTKTFDLGFKQAQFKKEMGTVCILCGSKLK